MTMPLATVREEIAKIASLVLTARRLVGEGRAVDLHNLEPKVIDACAAAVALPKDEARDVLGDLQSLVGELDHLAHDLSAAWDQILNATADPAAASAAYARGAPAARK